MTTANDTAADPAAFEAALRAAGYEVLTRELAPGQELEEHSHAWDVSALVLAGELTLGTAAGERTYRAGERFELPAGTPHVERHGPAGARLLLGRRHPPDAG